MLVAIFDTLLWSSESRCEGASYARLLNRWGIREQDQHGAAQPCLRTYDWGETWKWGKGLGWHTCELRAIQPFCLLYSSRRVEQIGGGEEASRPGLRF